MSLQRRLYACGIVGALLAVPHVADATTATIAADSMADFEGQAWWLTGQDCANWYPGSSPSGYSVGSFPNVVFYGGCYDANGNLLEELDWVLNYQPDSGSCGAWTGCY